MVGLYAFQRYTTHDQITTESARSTKAGIFLSCLSQVEVCPGIAVFLLMTLRIM